MSDAKKARGRTKPSDDDFSSDEEVDKTHSDNAQGRYRSRVHKFANTADWPQEPLYQVGEVVYVAIANQQQPSGPYIIVSSNYQDATYVIKRMDNGQLVPGTVAESQLCVPA